MRAGDSVVHLSGIEQSLLYLLASRSGQVVTRDEILDAIWGTDFVAESNIVDRHVRSLRIKLQNDYRHPRFIATVPGAGLSVHPDLLEPGLGRQPGARRAAAPASAQLTGTGPSRQAPTGAPAAPAAGARPADRDPTGARAARARVPRRHRVVAPGQMTGRHDALALRSHTASERHGAVLSIGRTNRRGGPVLGDGPTLLIASVPSSTDGRVGPVAGAGPAPREVGAWATRDAASPPMRWEWERRVS